MQLLSKTAVSASSVLRAILMVLAFACSAGLLLAVVLCFCTEEPVGILGLSIDKPSLDFTAIQWV